MRRRTELRRQRRRQLAGNVRRRHFEPLRGGYHAFASPVIPAAEVGDMHARGNRGFTFVELLTACSIFVVLLAIAVPSFTAFRQSTTLVSVERELMTALYIGRSNAI